MKKKTGILLSLVLAGSTILGACGKTEEKKDASPAKSDFKLGMVTDTGGVDDKSFNQSAWEGLTKFGKDNGLKEGEGYKYLQSHTDADYLGNLTKFADANYNLTYGIGFLLSKAVGDVAKQFPKNNFGIVDSVVDAPNVASIVFKEEQGSYLVGIAAAMTSKTNKIGFVGGVKSDLIKKFEVGYIAGAKSVNPNIEVEVNYADGFNNPEKGAQLAAAMYGQKADVIYHAAGNTGNGIFTEAKNRKKKGENVWVVGVDRDQHQEGMPENVTLTSMVKRVDVAVEDVAKQAKDGKFPGGKIVEYGIKENAIDAAKTGDNLSKEMIAKIEEAKKGILDGTIKVPVK